MFPMEALLENVEHVVYQKVVFEDRGKSKFFAPFGHWLYQHSEPKNKTKGFSMVTVPQFSTFWLGS